MGYRSSLRAGVCLFLGCSALATPEALGQLTVSVDAGKDAHRISPLIYGMNFPSDGHLAGGRVPLSRWGGNRTSRYNYEIDVDNTGADYYFENLPGCWSAARNWCTPAPADPKEQSGANALLRAAAARGAATWFTLPTLGWVAKAPPRYGHPFECGFPRSFAATQDSFDPFETGCGNGRRGGAFLTPPAPTTTSVAAGPAYAGAYARYLAGKFGPAGGARRVYALDNEPNLWSSTHHDVHPERLGYDELWQRMRDHALAILSADPTAEIAGPAEWGWPNYFCSDADDIQKGCSAASPDRARHGGVELTAWLLDQARAYEAQSGKRILHYLDLHYYPQGGEPPQTTRSLWDPSYRDPSWINETIRLIPRMREWVAGHYPGTKLAISEYDFYRHDDATGAITYAEVLGIFGREGLDAAMAWAPPAEGEAAFGAWRLYRDFDGKGGAFEGTSVRATVSGGAGVEAYAAVSRERATVALVNERPAPVTVKVTLAGFEAQGAGAWYTGAGLAITRQPDAAPRDGGYSVTLPATSFGMLAVAGVGPEPPPAPDGGGGEGATDLGGGSGVGAGPGEGGCGCRVGGGTDRGAGRGGAAAGLALVAAAVLLRRRR